MEPEKMRAQALRWRRIAGQYDERTAAALLEAAAFLKARADEIERRPSAGEKY
jgi:hypothetical protein